MATFLSPTAIISPPSSTKPVSKTQLPPNNFNFKPLFVASAASAAATILLFSSPIPSSSASEPSSLHLYYGTAASAASYGGYGGNASKKDTAEYTYLVPDSWKERLVSKIDKGTNGTDSEFYNPKKRSEKEYLTFLAGFRGLVPKEAVLNNLALSDVDLQDLIVSAEEEEGGVKSKEVRDEKGHMYYEYEIEGTGAHSLIKVTCARNKLYAHFVIAPNAEWSKDEDMLRQMHDSFQTVDDTS